MGITLRTSFVCVTDSMRVYSEVSNLGLLPEPQCCIPVLLLTFFSSFVLLDNWGGGGGGEEAAEQHPVLLP